MIVIESPFKKTPGKITLPDYDDFTRPMFDVYSDEVKRLAPQGETGARNYLIGRVAAFAGAHLVSQYGKWEIEGLTVDEFKAWANNPAVEKVRFVAWFAKSFNRYYSEVVNPNALALKSEDG